MQIRGLALTTELALAVTHGRVTDRGDYLVVELVDEPGWAYGNYLVLPRPLRQGELAHWIRCFEQELGTSRTVSLRWDDPRGDVGAADELLAAGFTLDANDVLAADDVVAPAHESTIRALEPDEVLATAEVAWLLADRHDETFRQFLTRHVRWQRELVASGRASFYGAFDGTSLVASLGLFDLGTLARYQDVQTLPSHRRRGLAGALLAAAARDARARSVERFVIFADPGGAAARVYQRVGFRVVEHTVIARRATK